MQHPTAETRSKVLNKEIPVPLPSQKKSWIEQNQERSGKVEPVTVRESLF